jgi:hypothetical protein
MGVDVGCLTACPCLSLKSGSKAPITQGYTAQQGGRRYKHDALVEVRFTDEHLIRTSSIGLAGWRRVQYNGRLGTLWHSEKEHD